jgi:hypothetical protein
MATIVTPATVAAYTPAESRDALNAECLHRILAGLPLPEALQPQSHAAPRPSSTREGVERILGIAPGREIQ